eukprot:4184706-Alexandrium_andersonii.AAC.1
MAPEAGRPEHGPGPRHSESQCCGLVPPGSNAGPPGPSAPRSSRADDRSNVLRRAGSERTAGPPASSRALLWPPA